MNFYQINTNNYYQLNQFQNSLNLKVTKNKDFDNDMIDYGVIIINKAYNLMNDGKDRAKYIVDSFDSKYPQGKHWNCFILSLSFPGCFFYSSYYIYYSTGKEYILIFA